MDAAKSARELVGLSSLNGESNPTYEIARLLRSPAGAGLLAMTLYFN